VLLVLSGCVSTTKLSNQQIKPPSVLLEQPLEPILLTQSPATLADLFTVHIENARRYESARNQLKALIEWHEKQNRIVD
jgi:hypothetical protein